MIWGDTSMQIIIQSLFPLRISNFLYLKSMTKKCNESKVKIKWPFSSSWKTIKSQFAAEHDVNVEPWAERVIWRIKILDKIWNKAPFVWSVICQQSGLKVEWSAAGELDTWYFPEKEILESDFISGIKDLHSGAPTVWSLINNLETEVFFEFSVQPKPRTN